MKKITLLMLIISAVFTIISCSGDSGGDTDKGYVDPGDWDGKFVSSLKSYSIAGQSCAPGAPPDEGRCNTIIYKNKLNKVNYVGIAVNNAHLDITPPSFNLKIYWEASEIPTGAGLTLNSCTAILNDQREENLTINGVTITNVTPGGSDVTVYTITFGTAFFIDGTNIGAGSTITAVKYP